jgi:hypothetical protein
MGADLTRAIFRTFTAITAVASVRSTAGVMPIPAPSAVRTSTVAMTATELALTGLASFDGRVNEVRRVNHGSRSLTLV